MGEQTWFNSENGILRKTTSMYIFTQSMKQVVVTQLNREGIGNPLQYSGLENLKYSTRSLVGYSPWGHERVGHNLASKQQG